MSNPYYPVYDFFKGIGANLIDKKILDFGGNRGNLIKSSNGAITQKNYTCLDVDKEALSLGKRVYPEASWIYYDRYNPIYNKSGSVSELPPLEEKYDVIIAYSVFTHTTLEEMQTLISVLYEHLNDDGKIWFTWCNIDYYPCYKFFQEKRVSYFGFCDSLPKKDFAYLCDNVIKECPTTDDKFFVSFFKEKFVLESLVKFNPINHKPFGLWFMDCIEIRKEKNESDCME